MQQAQNCPFPLHARLSRQQLCSAWFSKSCFEGFGAGTPLHICLRKYCCFLNHTLCEAYSSSSSCLKCPNLEELQCCRRARRCPACTTGLQAPSGAAHKARPYSGHTLVICRGPTAAWGQSCVPTTRAFRTHESSRESSCCLARLWPSRGQSYMEYALAQASRQGPQEVEQELRCAASR